MEMVSQNPPPVKGWPPALRFSPFKNAPPRPPALENPPKNGSACEPHRKWIEEQVRLGRNAMAIYQDMVELFAFTHQYNSVKAVRWKGSKRRTPVSLTGLNFFPEKRRRLTMEQERRRCMTAVNIAGLVCLSWC